MNPDIKIAVIGGTGKSGQYVVRQLIEQGYNFNILVRNPEHFTINSPSANIVPGNVADPIAIDRLLKGCSAVISTLGLGIPPSEPDIFIKATANILAAMKKHGIQRYIVTTGLNVNAPGDEKSPKTQMATDWMYANYPESTKAKQQEFEILQQSDADWTMVRLPLIALTDDRPEIAISLTDCPGDGISAASLANFLIKQLHDTHYLKAAPFIANE